MDLLSYNAIDWGYAATLHAAEGLTVDPAYVFLTPHADRHATYVALSRHRNGVEAYWSTQDFADRDELERTLARSGLKDTTLDYPGSGPLPDPIEPTTLSLYGLATTERSLHAKRFRAQVSCSKRIAAAPIRALRSARPHR